MDTLVSCVRSGFRNRSETILKRFTRPIRCSTLTRNELSPRLYSFSSSLSSPLFGFLYGNSRFAWSLS
jgi:hypothetical protein